MSRVMFIAKGAKNPNAAKLWTDYILSKRGQTVVANQAELGSIRADVEGESTLAGFTKALGAGLKPIPVGPGPARLPRPDQAARVHQAVAAGDQGRQVSRAHARAACAGSNAAS